MQNTQPQKRVGKVCLVGVVGVGAVANARTTQHGGEVGVSMSVHHMPSTAQIRR